MLCDGLSSEHRHWKKVKKWEWAWIHQYMLSIWISCCFIDCVLVPERWTKNSKSDLWRCWHVSVYSRKHTWNYLCKCWTEDCGSVRLFALYTTWDSSLICRNCLVTNYCEHEGKEHSLNLGEMGFIWAL